MSQSRILVIEDNSTNLELLMFLLRSSGHEAIAVRDGASGIRRAAELMPDLIVCDIQLPTIDGYEVARRLKADNVLRSINLLAVTACAMPADRQRAMAAGFDGYISKPITPETFCKEIARYLPQSETSKPSNAQASKSPGPAVCRGTPAEPCHASQSPTAPDAASLDVSTFGRLDVSILLAEHSRSNLDLLLAMLRPAGGRAGNGRPTSDGLQPVHVARSVAETLRVLEESRPAALITALELAGGGAAALLKASRRSEVQMPAEARMIISSSDAAGFYVPTLVLAPAAAPDEALRQFAGVADVMRWPIDPAELLAWVGKAIKRETSTGVRHSALGSRPSIAAESREPTADGLLNVSHRAGVKEP